MHPTTSSHDIHDGMWETRDPEEIGEEGEVEETDAGDEEEEPPGDRSRIPA